MLISQFKILQRNDLNVQISFAPNALRTLICFYCFMFNSNKRKMKQTIVTPNQFERVVSFQIVRRFLLSFISIFQLYH